MTLPSRRKHPTTARSLPAIRRKLARAGQAALGFSLCAALLHCVSFLQAADAPGGSLKWRPHSQARSVSVEKKSKITRTQLLGPTDGNPLRVDEPAEELPSLDLAPGVRPVLQPDPNPSLVPDAPRVPRRGSMPNLEEQFSMGPSPQPAKCPSPSDLKRVTVIDLNLTAPEGDFPQFCPLTDTTYQPRQFEQLTYTWKATALCHKPLYFEERALERYGHTTGFFQPLVSGVMFFGTLPILPYKMGMHSPWECMYALGYYQPGDCAPWIIPPVPLNLRGGLLEAGAWTGGVYLIP